MKLRINTKMVYMIKYIFLQEGTYWGVSQGSLWLITGLFQEHIPSSEK